MMLFLLLVFVVIWLIVRSRDRQKQAAAEAEMHGRIYALEIELQALRAEAVKPQPDGTVEIGVDRAAPGPPVPPQADTKPWGVAVPARTEAPVLRLSQSGAGPTGSVPQWPAPGPPESGVPEPAQAHRGLSLEERLGANWLNKLGIVILVFGVAFFLAYQLKNLGPVGKTLAGFAVSATLLAGGLALERREKYRIFARPASAEAGRLLSSPRTRCATSAPPTF